MEKELLRVFDENRNPIGIATREEVHRVGLWHETFHCWFISKEEDDYFIYFQLRSDKKKDYPSLLDITAAGHLLSHETVEDGVREIKEETGIDVNMKQLVSLGIIDYELIHGELIDKELANVYLYKNKISFEDFHVQTEEVAGMFKAKLTHFTELWLGSREELFIEGFQTNASGEKGFMKKLIRKNLFVPHEKSYYEKVLAMIHEHIC